MHTSCEHLRMNLTILYWLLIGVMMIGVVGAILPNVPGPSLILAAILVWCIATKFAMVDWWLGVIFGVLILSAAVEWLAVYWGAKQVGASKWSQYGMVAGITLGFFGLLPALPLGGPLFGVLFGGILGAFAGEFLYQGQLGWKERFQQSFKVSMAIVVGSIVGNLVEGLLAIVAVGLFIWSTWPPVAI
jgi:uncharacterized protein